MSLLICSLPVVSASEVTHYGWNSCSKGWYKTGGCFENYCPFCHHSGTLRWNPKHTAEGEWTCSHCDADFCVCGKCKGRGSGVYLVKSKKSNTTVKQEPISSPTVTTPTPLKLIIISELGENYINKW